MPILLALVSIGQCQNPIMVIGGFNQDQGELSDVEIVDVSDNETFCFKPKPYPVSIHGGSGEVLDGKITVCGGFSEKLATFPNCHTYDTIADDWVELRGGSMIQNRLNPGSVLLEQGWWFSGKDKPNFKLYYRRMDKH